MKKWMLSLLAIFVVAMAIVPAGVLMATPLKPPTHVAKNTWTLPLTSKDSSTWLPTIKAKATITILNTVTTTLPADAQSEGVDTTSAYTLTLTATGLQIRTAYSIIYYADPWAGTGGHEIASFTTGSRNCVSFKTVITADSWQSIPCDTDDNYPVGGKIWIVPSSDYSGGQMTSWNPNNYLFETALVSIP